MGAMATSVDAAAFRAAMARFPGAVTIVTARTPAGERRGITATAVCSVTADPPSLLVCLNRRTGTCATVAETGRFAVNLLPGDGGPLAMRFAGAGGITGEDKFAEGCWRDDPQGVPVLAEAALDFSCEVSHRMDSGTHTVFIGRIVALSQGEAAPLLYERSRFHRLEPLA